MICIYRDVVFSVKVLVPLIHARDDGKAEPEEKLEERDERLETVSSPESELTETDQPVEQEPTLRSDQEPISTLRHSMRQRRPPLRFRDFIVDL